MAQPMLCTQCGTVAVSRQVTPGSGWITFVLFWFFIVPGLIYWIWRHTSTYQVCSQCGSKSLIPPTAPLAQTVIAAQPQVATSLIAERQRRKDQSVGTFTAIGIIVLFFILAWISEWINTNGGQIGPTAFLPLILVVVLAVFLWRLIKRARPGS
jgi:hypothetical protein